MNDDNALIKRGPHGTVWYVVAHASDMAGAAIPAGLLRSAGMPVFLFREAINSVLPLMSFGGVDIAVPEAYYVEAMGLLESDGPYDELPPEAGDPDED
jgi:hypothetical protein